MRRVLVIGLLAISPSAVSADSFTPIRMQISVAPVARLHKPLTIKLTVSADPGVLDVRDGPMMARVKLATGECGGDYHSTVGTVLLNRALTPQPDPGEAYQGSATGSGKPTAYGVQNVCVFLEDRGSSRQFANDTTDFQVNVSQKCTRAAAKYDAAAAAYARAKRRHRNVAQRRAAANAAKRKARSACGPGVPL